MTLHAALPVPIPAVIHVIAAVPTNIPEGQRTTPAAKPVQLSAGRLAVTVKTVLQEAVLTPILMPALPNAELVIIVPIIAGPDKSLFLALQIITKYACLLPNAAPDVIPASIILIVP